MDTSTTRDPEARGPARDGILPAEDIAALAEAGSIRSAMPFAPDQIQPASLDLRLGRRVFRVRTSFLPGRERAMLATGLPRYEQVYRVMGEVRVEGEPAYPFTGTGVRTHRYGRRVATGDWFHGSSWLSALFPSGRAFGSVQYLGNSGEAVYSDAAVTDVRGLPVQARVTATPWLTRYDCVGQRVEWCYEQDGKPGVIRGEIVAAAYNYGFGLDRTPGIVNWCHTMTRFEWDGEETYGMMELGMITDRLID